MGLMKLFEAGIKLVTVPVAVVVDVFDHEVVLGDKESRTKKTLKSIKDDIDEIGD